MTFSEFMDQFMSTFHVSSSIGLIVMIVVFVLEIKYNRTHRETVPEKVEKARQMGHVVKARIIRRYPGDRDKKYEHAIYEYEVDGRVYKYNFVERKFPPETITLLWLNNPKHAFWQYHETAAQSASKIAWFFLPFATGIAVMVVLESVFHI